MMTGYIAISAMLLGEIMLAPVPANVVPRNEIERLVLAQPESASRKIENLLTQDQDKEGRNRALIDAGFKRVRPNDACANYTYSRQLTDKLVRGASVILCEGKQPFVLRSDETPGPWMAPAQGQPSAIAPKAPK